MGEGTNGVTVKKNGSNGVHGPKHGKTPAQLEQKVGIIREHLTDVVSELDHRRHEAMDVRGQLKKHAPLVAGVVGGALLIGGAITGYSIYRARTRPKVIEVEKKEYEGILHKILSAAAGAIVGVVAKTLAQKLMAPASAAAVEEPPALPD